MRKPDKPIVCYVTDRKSLGDSEHDARRGTVECDASAAPAAVVARIRMAIEAGVDWIQIREKDLAAGRLLALTREAVAAANELGARERGSRARIYVNDRLDVALAAMAGGGVVKSLPAVAGLAAVAGVHLGGESLPVADVVRWRRAGNAPAEFQIGVSTHSVEQARQAERDGADYISFGPIFDTPSKRSFGPPQGTERLREVCRALRIPVIAIGGINESNAGDCIRAGASGIAAIRVFQEAASAEELARGIRRMRAGD